MKVIITILYLLLIVNYGCAQIVSLVPRAGAIITTEKGFYNSYSGIFGGSSLRITSSHRFFFQGGWNYNLQFFDDDRIKNGAFQSWDWQLGVFVGDEVKPYQITIGTFMHKYRFVRNPIIVQGYTLIPETKEKKSFDGLQFAVGYTFRPRCEVRLVYETEPLLFFKYSKTADYLRIELNYLLPFHKIERYKSGSKLIKNFAVDYGQ